MSLTPGDVLVYTIAATDNHVTADAQNQVGRSSEMRIKIISEAEFDTRIRSDLAMLETRIRQAALDQADIMDRTQSLVRQIDEGSNTIAAQQEISANLAAEENRLIRRIQDLSRRFVKLTDRMVQNKAEDKESRNRISMLARELRNTASGPMNNAGSELNRLSQESQSAKRKERMELAIRSETLALEQLRALTRTMSQWGHFQGLVARARDLLDRQENIRNQTMQIGRPMIGKPLESLSRQEQETLKRTQRRQEQLAADIEQMINRMQEMLATLREKDPSGVSAVEEAIRTARAHHVARRARAAVDAIGSNRTAAATIEQRATSEAIRKMASALRERQDRELEEIRKQLEQAHEQIVQILQQQKTLRIATEHTGEKEHVESSFMDLSRNQRTLQRNTRFLGEELGETHRTVEVGLLVRHAATPMRSAMIKLRSSQPLPATAAQDQAIDLLKQALVQLEVLAQETAEEAFLRSLAQIREDLENIHTAQKDVNDGITHLTQDRDNQGRMTRALARRASKLARKQAEVRELVEVLMSEFDNVVVYRWVLERVAIWMEQVQGSLYDRIIGQKLVLTSTRIVRELEKLIGAIAETEALPVDTEFIEAASGGSGQGQKGSTKPVPTIAELLVLKGMQQDINQRTREWNESFNVDQATEEQLQRVQTIGEDQEEVRRLTERVTQRVRKH